MWAANIMRIGKEPPVLVAILGALILFLDITNQQVTSYEAGLLVSRRSIGSSRQLYLVLKPCIPIVIGSTRTHFLPHHKMVASGSHSTR
jgi:hypothetical protein